MGLCVEVVDCDCLGNFAANSSRPSGRFAISFTNTHLQKLREGEKKTGSLASEFQFTRLPALSYIRPGCMARYCYPYAAHFDNPLNYGALSGKTLGKKGSPGYRLGTAFANYL
jgi:hypothetical protein